MRKILIYSAIACVVVLTCIVIIVTHIASQLLSAAHLRLSDLSTNISPSQTTYTFLFLGVGGSEHEGPNLTDTIILAQYDLVKNRFMLTSLPRDLWDPQTKDKINATYTYALTQQPQAPFEYVKEKYFTLTGVTIDHVVVIDFTTFSKAIDALGGIDIVNDTAFIDRQFPLAGKENAICTPFDPTYACRYETVQFPAGPLHLDGAHALKYIRSRHSSEVNWGFLQYNI
jgi:LCP family protein required for cell wall assembly